MKVALFPHLSILIRNLSQREPHLCFVNGLYSYKHALLVKRKEQGEFAFGIEDLPYYVKKIKEEQCNLDFGVVKQYFPVTLVLSGIFKICQDLFGNCFRFLLKI